MATKSPKRHGGRKQDRPKKAGRNSKARRRIDEEDDDRSPITAEFQLDMEIVQLQRELEEVRIVACESSESNHRLI
ncbi:hypothetical protein THAOC_12516 [Thalassiosira oceanica]|uniref:Uncharacterized protein n=1 Tax=Thalassiosira oceanica TaxID=159749 RepID=K0SNM1_THAOC|nr:hypothetical protein THAOC_12516 [Thalassiosira oceanica]|eukprot:EJK66564.1 hypothetical protein THAOC_12516 [Thalassiosira oceanica]